MADYMTMLEIGGGPRSRARATRDASPSCSRRWASSSSNHSASSSASSANPQRSGKLGAEDVKSIESARKIYRALGDYRNVVRLYELELEGTADAKRRADLLLGLGRVLGEKLEELDAAAQRLSEVVRLRRATRRRSSCSAASTPTRTGSAPTASSAPRAI